MTDLLQKISFKDKHETIATLSQNNDSLVTTINVKP